MAQTILIVDDEEPVRHLFCRLFEDRGYRVTAVDSAESGVAMVLMDEELGVNHRRSLELACEQLNRAVKIMDNLRDFSKQRPAQRAETDANTLIDHTLELMVYELRKSSITAKTNFQSLPIVMADGDQLSQVFLNLVKNAIDAMPDGGTLRFDTRTVALRSEQGIEIKMSDSGMGIEKENISRLFDLFFTTKKMEQDWG